MDECPADETPSLKSDSCEGKITIALHSTIPIH